MNEQYAITTGDLTKGYGETTAVGISNSPSQPGPCTGSGPNGAGKTTTIRVLTALTEPTSGTGHVAGQPITERQAIIRNISAICPNYPPIYNELTAREQLEYHGSLHDMYLDDVEDRIEELLDRFRRR